MVFLSFNDHISTGVCAINNQIKKSRVFYYSALTSIITKIYRGWSGGAMVLGKLPVPGRPTNLDYSRARAYCTCSR